ncbi:MAG: HAMP domain-containing histidine kinase [Alphaproteobacteria bacterium]|nr:HAMP domain-containing histidine kinase [Alphaproteobacteria bacterium]MDE2112090.1 HAMP domain-containing histidine kinase [Alphaproteobacteria bacterium]MDE2493888.1 HAMP domain-containing histidine kinase [Alphaproteobacteria bacterium]
MEIRLFRTESFRLTAIFALLFVGATLVLSGVLYAIVDSAFKSEVLLNAGQDLAAIRKGYDSEGISEAKEVVNQRLARPTTSNFLLLQNAGGKKIAGNLPAITPAVGTVRLPISAARKDDRRAEHRILGRGQFIAPGVYAFAGQDLAVFNAAEREALRAIGWTLTAALIFAVAAGILLSRGFLRRMDTITQTCQAIMAGQLSDRIPVPGTQDELSRLASTINAMLDRINALMENVRQISTDIAHDLRTPLTRLRHHLELARAEAATVDEYGVAVDHGIEDTNRILSIFSALLRISQIEAGAGRASFQRVDLQKIVKNLADLYGPAAEDKKHILEANADSSVDVFGDRELLSQMFVNLIENAITHTPDGARVTIDMTATEASVSVRVADNGPGIPPDEREKVFRRFYRLERGRSTPGSGLGLALVAAIAQIHYATVELSDNAPGLCATVTFRKLS